MRLKADMYKLDKADDVFQDLGAKPHSRGTRFRFCNKTQ